MFRFSTIRFLLGLVGEHCTLRGVLWDCAVRNLHSLRIVGAGPSSLFTTVLKVVKKTKKVLFIRHKALVDCAA